MTPWQELLLSLAAWAGVILILPYLNQEQFQFVLVFLVMLLLIMTDS